MLSIISFACGEFGWNVQYAVEDVPMIFIMLLARQKVFTQTEHPGFTLEEQEELDNLKNVSWDELVRRNREQLAKQGKI